MARVLIVVPPLTGHVNPTRGVGAALLARGHAVAWCGYPGKLGELPEGGERFALPEHDPSGVATDVLAQSRELRGLRSVKFFVEAFMLPLARAMLPGVRAAVDAFRPDVLLVDQQALAGMLVARERGLPWITSASTSAGVVDPLDAFPQIRAWQDGLIDALQREIGLDPVARPDLSPHGVIVYTTRALIGDDLPSPFHLVGPVANARPDVPFPWEALAPVRRVLVSLGTVSHARGDSFYRAICEALGPLDLQVILVAPAELVPDPPPNVLRRDHVPQVALLSHVDAVVCHGGHNTVVEALAAGKPLVLAPIRDDQPVVVNQVVAAGAGVRVKFGRARPEGLRQAVLDVLDEPRYRASAARIAESFAASGGAELAADVVLGALPR